MFNERTVIIDCALGRTSLGVFDRSGEAWRMTEYHAIDHRADARGESAWLDATRKALPALRVKVGRAAVTLVYPAGLLLLKHVKLPPLDAGQREKIIRFEAAQGIPVPLGEVIWGYTEVSSEESGTLVCAAKRQGVDALCQAAEQAGLRVAQLTPAPLAVLRAARSAALPANGPHAILCSDNHGATLILRSGKSTRVRATPLAIEAAAPPETVAARLAAELARTIAHFCGGGAGEAPKELFVAGAHATKPVAEALAARANMPAQVFDALRAVEVAGGAGAAGAAKDAARLTELIGTAADPDGPAISLLPARLRATESQLRRRPWWAVAAALAALCAAPPYLHFRGLRLATEAKTAAIEAESAPVRERETRIRSLLQELDEARRTHARLAALHDRRDAWLGLLADLQERLGRIEDVWFDSMKVVPAGEPGAAGHRITVAGRLLDRTNPRSTTVRDSSTRVRDLLADINASPFVSVAGEKFDTAQAGILNFNFTLVPKPARPL